MATPNTEPASLELSQFQHTPFYCEENVYWLCKKLCANGMADEKGSDLFVVFISNEQQEVPLWQQKASAHTDGIVFWDYHVICIQRKRPGDSPYVWDLDSRLPCPCPLTFYLSETIRPSFPFPEYKRFFRIVHAPIYLRCFASDRRHMKDSNGNWIAQPPGYEPIVAEDGEVHNLNEYIQIHATDALRNIARNAVFSQKLGVVVREDQLTEFFSQFF